MDPPATTLGERVQTAKVILVRSRARIPPLAEVCIGGTLENMRAFVVLYARPRPGSVQMMIIHAANEHEFNAVLLPGPG